MRKNILTISFALMLCVTGCAHILPPSPQERIAQYQVRCESMGFKAQTIEHSYCVLELEKAYISGRGNRGRGVTPASDDARIQQMIDNDRMQKQILKHGAGGCTPNFATGGCL
jgi:hypothetical protein